MRFVMSIGVLAETNRFAIRATGVHQWPTPWHHTAACATLSEMKSGAWNSPLNIFNFMS
jgi:hypothetical protein